jgi:8-oxo-dGTP pyrophosphatase MutT (NUDIX family)
MLRTQLLSIETVRRAMARALPGLPAQEHMSPPYRSGIVPREIVNPNYGGVLILLYPRDGELHFVLMRRSDHPEDRHKGQISLPGGRHETADADYRATALREAREELGIGLESYELLGTLSTLYIPPSNFYIYPLVAYTPLRPAFVPDPGEVAELIEVPLRTLLDPQTRIVEEWTMPQLNNTTVMMPHYHIDDHKVWGATAMVLAEFADLVNGELQSGAT